MYWHQMADERLSKPSPKYQEPLVVKDKVGTTLDELGLSKSVECDTFSFQCFDTVGWVESWELVCWW